LARWFAPDRVSFGVIALVAGAAIAHAVWNLTIKHAGTSGTGFLWLTFAVGAVLFAPLGITSLVQPGVPLGLLALLAAGSALLQLGYFLLLQRGYRLGDVSIVYPLARGTGPLLSVIFAIVLFREVPTAFGLLGALVVVVGVVVIGLAGGRSRFAGNRTGILYGALVGVVIAAYTLWDANAVVTHELPPVGYYWVSLVIQLVVFAPFALRGPTRPSTIVTARTHWRAVIVVGILAPLAYVLILFAFQVAPVSLVAPAREVSVVLVTLAGWLLFKEPHPAQRVLGALIVLGGVALLSIA
jgi:drug/metabolite transporter (DMT)-like permease